MNRDVKFRVVINSEKEDQTIIGSKSSGKREGNEVFITKKCMLSGKILKIRTVYDVSSLAYGRYGYLEAVEYFDNHPSFERHNISRDMGAAEKIDGKYVRTTFDKIFGGLIQFTGLYDCEGREIFEGDILSDGEDVIEMCWADYSWMLIGMPFKDGTIIRDSAVMF